MSASLRCRFSPHTTPLRVYQQAPVSLRRCSCRLAPARGSATPHAEDVGWGGAGVGDAFLGKRLRDVARAAGHADLESRAPFEAVFDFYVSNQGDIGIITHHGNEPTVERFFRRRYMAVCTDWLMPGPGQKTHPRAPGAFPRAPGSGMVKVCGISPCWTATGQSTF